VKRAAAAVILLALFGCEPQDQSGPTTLPDGVRTINKSMRGIWNAPGGPGCAWSIRVKSGDRWVTVSRGSGNKSQTAIIGSSHVGGQFRSDKCKGWSR
jgi:hypothetical protein